MADVIVIGDGPGGLSAALFRARAGHATTVFGEDETAMHYALLRNYLGVRETAGSDFQQVAREQVTAAGADLRGEAVTAVTPRDDGAGFEVETADGARASADYVVLAGGKACQALADALGVARDDSGVTVDAEGRTSVDRVYAVGRLTRQHRSQAVISAGAGARAALDILARETGRDVTDWDTPDD